MFNAFDLGELLSFDGNYKLKKKISKLFKFKQQKNISKKKYNLINFYNELDKVNNKNELKLLTNELDNNRNKLFDNTLKRKKINYNLNINKKIKSKKKLGIEYESKIKKDFNKIFNVEQIKLKKSENSFYFKTMIPDIIYKNKDYYGIMEIKYKSKFNDKISLTNLTQLVIYILFYNRKISEGYLIECFSSNNIFITYVSTSFAINFYNFYIKDKIKKLYNLYKLMNK